MTIPLTLGPVHHLRLTVTDVERSRVFYTELLGFQTAMDSPPPVEDPHHDLTLDLLQGGVVLANGDLLLGLRPVDAERAIVSTMPSTTESSSTISIITLGTKSILYSAPR